MRSFKKISAIVLAIAMMLSVVSMSAFAVLSGENEYNVTYTIKNSANKQITATKADKDVYVDVYVTANEYKNLAVTFQPIGTVTAGDITVNYDNYNEDGLINSANGQIKLAWTGKVIVTSDKALATIKVKVPASATVGANNLLEMKGFSVTANNESGNVDKAKWTNASIDVAESFTPNHYGKAYTTGLGTSAENIITALGDTATAYENVDESTGKTADVKVGTWTAPENFDADKTGDYNFTAPVLVDENEDSLANVTANQTATAKVTISKIDLSTETNVTTTAPAEKTYMLSKTAATKTADEIKDELNADAKYTQVKISKSGKYEEDATVVWTVKSGTSLDLATLSTETTNIVTLEGKVKSTAASDKTNYTGEKTITCVAKVVPAEITGSKFSVDNAAQYGNANVTFTIPGAEVNGKKVTAYMYTKLKDGKVDESSLIAKSAKSTDAISAEVSSEEGVTPVTYKDYTGTIQFDSFDTLGLSTNDVFYVVLKVDTATVKNGENMYVESYVLPESNRRPGSGNSGNSGTVTVKKYDIKVSEGTNGTATVDKDAKAGDTVKVDVKPNDGYKVKEIIVKTADGKTVEVDQKNRTFVMPEGNVTVEVVYEEGTDEPTVVDGKFTDVPDTFWAAADIYTLKEAGIINGKSDKEFDPEGKVTRAEFTKMIVNLFGVKASSNTVSFTDCKADDWFTPFVAAAVEAGYVKGITDTEFAPDQTITREEACTILGRAYAQTSDKALNFTDASDIADFASAYVALLVDMGYVNGYTDGTFLPKNEITRAEAAKIIAGAFRAAEKAKTEVNDKENAEVKTDANAEVKTDAKADNGETAEK